MFVASYHNTERGAAASMEVRRTRVLAEIAALEKERCEREAEIKAARSDAFAAIKMANRALAQLRAREGKQGVRIQPHGDSLEHIANRMCKVFGFTRDEVRSKRRGDVAMSFCRQAIVYWAVRRTGRSLPQIGRWMNRDHTTILHSRRVYIEKRAKQGRTLRAVR
jgi:chromosomal replication initiation ATPase DnaA